jgi:hypothetical protein
MATQPTTKDEREPHETEKHAKSLIVVELAKRRSPDQVRRLRKGRGRLVEDELVKSGTIKSGTQPVVIVVREATLPLMWALDEDDEDVDDDDNDDDEDEDDDD